MKPPAAKSGARIIVFHSRRDLERVRPIRNELEKRGSEFRLSPRRSLRRSQGQAVRAGGLFPRAHRLKPELQTQNRLKAELRTPGPRKRGTPSAEVWSSALMRLGYSPALSQPEYRWRRLTQKQCENSPKEILCFEPLNCSSRRKEALTTSAFRFFRLSLLTSAATRFMGRNCSRGARCAGIRDIRRRIVRISAICVSTKTL
jgi:hypothetical protein